ncbi:MAG: tetratricopeptide repeat protein [Alphaproteobacteria bacterium]|nr:tetratricopeptide repeat protein [Alphaproteobacteria bacterium]
MAELSTEGAAARHHIAWARRAVLLGDIVESVRLVEQDEAGVIARWLDFIEHVRSVILPPRGGRLVKSLGDGFLLDFDDVRSAISAALAIQTESRRRNVGVPAERQIDLRMGLEISDVVIEVDDVLGRGVNLAQRLMGLAGPGEIVISQQARDGLTPTLDAEVEDLGDCFVRHLAQPVRAYRIGPPGPHPVVGAATPFEDIAPSIAIVPFESRNVAQDHGVIGQVLAEEVIRKLSHSSDLNLVSRLSTMAFAGRDFSHEDVGAHLRADYVLSGSYGNGEKRVRLDVELVEVKSGRILWAESFDDDASAILSGEQELIGQLIAGVTGAVMSRELQRSRAQPLPTLRAYTLLMGAVSLMHRLSLPDFEEAHRLLRALIDRGIRHPIPMAWLANWHVLRVQQGWSEDERQDAYLALECTKRALDIDPDCSLALAINGLVHVNLLKKLDVAQESYESALAANPSNALGWLLKGTLHAFKSEGRLAVAHTERALRLSPLDPHRYFYDSLASTACLAARQYDRALELAQSSLRANRKHTSTWRVVTVAQWQLGKFEEASRSAQELLKLQPTMTVSGWLKGSPAAPYPIGREAADILRQAGIPQ